MEGERDLNSQQVLKAGCGHSPFIRHTIPIARRRLSRGGAGELKRMCEYVGRGQSAVYEFVLRAAGLCSLPLPPNHPLLSLRAPPPFYSWPHFHLSA